MMQIYDDAIDKSRESDTQYIISKGLDTVLCEGEKPLLKFLKDGYKVISMFHNGAEYRTYVVRKFEEEKFPCLKHAILDLTQLSVADDIDTFVLSFVTYYDKFHKVEEVYVDISMFCEGHHRDTTRCLNETANHFQDILYTINAQTTTDAIKTYLEQRYGEK